MLDAAAPDAAGDAPPLDGPHRQWPETNCYVDLWLTLLSVWGEEPRAMLGFLAAVGFAGDQFTFAKPPHPALEALYGARVEEMTVYRSLESHLVAHANHGRPVLLEADAHWLPDAEGSDYRRGHTKSTVAVLSIDPAAGRLSYVHNRVRGELEGADYRGLLWQDPAPPPGWMPPFAEVVERRTAALRGPALAEAARGLLQHHLDRAPADPFAAMADTLAVEMEAVRGGGGEAFHLWAFATLRQAGAAFELLGLHAAWLGAALGVDASAAAAACARISSGAKTLQFRAARAARGGDLAPLSAAIRALGPERGAALGGLRSAFG
ncbi:DUF1839 family protein [Muricoccus radiodurans]|uniref:DUF1839 family protein n=1 Tax=Muricoccus radiodurans TaxID=2231721 RepID=UPI003CEF4747